MRAALFVAIVLGITALPADRAAPAASVEMERTVYDWPDSPYEVPVCFVVHSSSSILWHIEGPGGTRYMTNGAIVHSVDQDFRVCWSTTQQAVPSPILISGDAGYAPLCAPPGNYAIVVEYRGDILAETTFRLVPPAVLRETRVWCPEGDAFSAVNDVLTPLI